MLRIRWTDPDDDGELFGWRWPSAILATLFLNFFFWYGSAAGFYYGSALVFFTSLAVAPAIAFVLFFQGPAHAAQELRLSLFQLAEASLGIVPAVGFRIGCALLWSVWIAGISGFIAGRLSETLLHRQLSAIEAGAGSMLLMLMLIATGMKGIRTGARLAWFTNRLAIAMLIAGAIRMHAYLPGAWSDLFTTSGGGVWPRIGRTIEFTAPLALFAADFGHRSHSRRDVTLLGVFGLAVPMALTLFAAGILERAAYHWHPDRGLTADIALAMWGDSERYQALWSTLAFVTLFGIARFGVRTWRASLAPAVSKRGHRLALIAVTALVGAVLNAGGLGIDFFVVARIAAPIAAILTADHCARPWRRTGQIGKVDWLSLAALIAGCIASTGVCP